MSVICLFNLSAEANPENKLAYVNTYDIDIEGRTALRIELGFDNNEVYYQPSERYRTVNQLLLEFKNTKLGLDTKSIIVNSDIISKIVFIERENNSLDIRLYSSRDLTNTDNYNITLVPDDKRARTFTRLFIDIYVDNNRDVSNAVKDKIIVIDPGHGGSDSGAIGFSGSREKDIALTVAKMMEAELLKKGAIVVMTRYNDKDVYKPHATGKQELQARVDIANKNPNADIFVSIHCNAFHNPAANGIETFYYNKSVKDFRLAQYLGEELRLASGLKNRGTKEANFYVLKHTHMPATLIELGFITNQHEEMLLNDSTYQQNIATALAYGIAKYFNEVNK